MSNIGSNRICEMKEIIAEDLNKLREIKRLAGDTSNSNYTEQISKAEESIVKMYSDAERICETFKILFQEYENKRVKFEEYLQITGTLVSQKATLWAAYKLQTSFLMERLQKIPKTDTENIPKSNQEQIQEILAAKALKNYYKNSHGIIIGISEYEQENPLPNAYNDAKGIEKILKERYEFGNVITLYNENATRTNIARIIEGMVRNRKIIAPEDRVLIYYAGHGRLESLIGFEGEAQKIGYIVPYDAKKDDNSTYYDMEMLVKSCQFCIAKHILLILDCCYSGFAALRNTESQGNPSDTETYLRDVTSRRSIQVLAAGQEDQPVEDSGVKRGYSAFTGALLDILESGKDLNDDGILSASEIGSYLEREVTRHAMGAQKPVFNHLSGSKLGDFIFSISK